MVSLALLPGAGTKEMVWRGGARLANTSQAIAAAIFCPAACVLHHTDKICTYRWVCVIMSPLGRKSLCKFRRKDQGKMNNVLQ